MQYTRQNRPRYILLISLAAESLLRKQGVAGRQAAVTDTVHEVSQSPLAMTTHYLTFGNERFSSCTWQLAVHKPSQCAQNNHSLHTSMAVNSVVNTACEWSSIVWSNQAIAFELRDTEGYSRIFSHQWELSGLFTVWIEALPRTKGSALHTQGLPS